MKKANLIIIGGTIAAGKSTLVENLSNKFNWYAVPELRENDAVQDIVLKKLYDGTRLHSATIQCYFINNRIKQYEDNSNRKNLSILDRGIWEDWMFAKLWLAEEPKVHKAYIDFWKSSVEKLVNDFGIPKAYVFLSIDWKSFEERIFERNRQSEIQNFNKNKPFFKKLLKEYNDNFINILKDWGIKPLIIKSAKLQPIETLEATIKYLKENKVV